MLFLKNLPSWVAPPRQSPPRAQAERTAAKGARRRRRARKVVARRARTTKHHQPLWLHQLPAGSSASSIIRRRSSLAAAANNIRPPVARQEAATTITRRSLLRGLSGNRPPHRHTFPRRDRRPRRLAPLASCRPWEPDEDDAEYFHQGMVAFGSMDVAAQLAKVNNFTGWGSHPSRCQREVASRSGSHHIRQMLIWRMFTTRWTPPEGTLLPEAGNVAHTDTSRVVS